LLINKRRGIIKKVITIIVSNRSVGFRDIKALYLFQLQHQIAAQFGMSSKQTCAAVIISSTLGKRHNLELVFDTTEKADEWCVGLSIYIQKYRQKYGIED
jgi:hypothetical protein